MQPPGGGISSPSASVRDLADVVSAVCAASGDSALASALGGVRRLLEADAARISITCSGAQLICELSADGDASRRADPPAPGPALSKRPRVIAPAEVAAHPQLAGTALVGPGVAELLVVPVDHAGVVALGVFARRGGDRFDDFDVAIARVVVEAAALKVAALTAAAPGVTSAADGLAGSQPVKATGSRRAIRILVAEDNPINQRLIVRILNRLGHLADVAGNGVEVLEAVAQQRYDLVFMDVQMPEMSGLEAARQIRERMAIGTRPKIVAMTANASEDDREACLGAGMDDYLCKPIRLGDVESALARWTRRG